MPRATYKGGMEATYATPKRQRSRLVPLVAGFVASIALLGACSAGSESSEFFGYVPPSVMKVDSASVTEAGTNKPFAFKAAQGEVLVVYFGYTNCPDLCPATMVAVRNAKRKIGDLASRVDLAMVTVDRERDTVDILPKYLSSFSDRYHALVPTSDEELRAAEAVFQATSSVTKKPDGTVEVAHGGTAYVVDDTGTVVVEWPFGLDAESMAHDLKILLGDKA